MVNYMVVQPCLTFSKNFISFAIVAKMLTKIVPIIKKAFRYLIFFKCQTKSKRSVSTVVIQRNVTNNLLNFTPFIHFN